MPNIQSAKKRVASNKRKNDVNTLVKSSMKTAIKKFEKDVEQNNKKDALESLNLANKKIDKALKAGIIKDNKAARDKSRLQKLYNNLG